MLYVIYRVYADEPNKGYYWGKYKDPIQLANACYNMYPLGFYGFKIIQHEDDGCIEPEIDLNEEC